MCINLEKVIRRVASYLRVKLFGEWVPYGINKVAQIQMKSPKATTAHQGLVISRTN